MQDVKRFSLVKPTIKTPFHIDFDWWQSHDHNWRVHLHSLLCPEHQALYTDSDIDIKIDAVDPKTAEVTQIDGLLHTLIVHCAKKPTFTTEQTTLVNGVFRILLSNGNEPLSPEQLGNLLGKQPEIILRTLTGPIVYQGIRPIAS